MLVLVLVLALHPGRLHDPRREEEREEAQGVAEVALLNNNNNNNAAIIIIIITTTITIVVIIIIDIIDNEIGTFVIIWLLVLPGFGLLGGRPPKGGPAPGVLAA